MRRFLPLLGELPQWAQTMGAIFVGRTEEEEETEGGQRSPLLASVRTLLRPDYRPPLFLLPATYSCRSHPPIPLCPLLLFAQCTHSLLSPALGSPRRLE